MDKDRNTFTKTFESKATQKMTERNEKLINPGDKIKSFQAEVKDDREAKLKLEESEKYHPTVVKKKNLVDRLQDILFPKRKKTAEQQKEEQRKVDESKFDKVDKFEGMEIQDVIAPLDIEVDFNHIQIGDPLLLTSNIHFELVPSTTLLITR